MKLRRDIFLAGSIPGGTGESGGSIPGGTGKHGGSISGKSSNNNGNGDVTCIVVDSLKKNEITYAEILRNWRDDCLANSYIGRTFIKLYYIISPMLVKVSKKMPIINKIVRKTAIVTSNFVY